MRVYILRRWLAALAVIAAAMIAGSAAARCADWVPQPKPQNASRDIIGQDLDQIIERGFIEFALYEAFPPWSWQEGGKAKGVDVEIASIIADAIGVEPRFRLVAAGETLDADLRNYIWKGPVVGGSVANIMMHVPYDSEFSCRVEQVVFTGQSYRESIAIAYRDDAYPEEKPVPAYFRFDTVAVENDTISDFYLSSLAGGALSANVHRYPNYEMAMAALAAGEVKAAMGPRGELEHGLQMGISIHEPPLPGFSRGSWTLGIAVHHAYRALAYTADAAIEEALADGRIEEIFAAHGLTYSAPER